MGWIVMDESFRQMREFIVATEHLTEPDPVETPPLVEAIQPEVSLIEDLERVIFKLRAFMESADGDFALGVEMGMQRAADMVENVIKRHAGE